MAVTVAGISASGLQVDRMMTTAYLEGRTKVNATSGLLTGKPTRPDFSGIKLDRSSVTKMPEEGGSQTGQIDSETMQMYTVSASEMKYVKQVETTYTLHGATFTYSQFHESKDFMEGMAAVMRENGVLSGALDYSDYANMGLMENHLREFGKNQGYNSQQIEALAKDYQILMNDFAREQLQSNHIDKQIQHTSSGKYFIQFKMESGTVATVQDAACNWGMVKSFYNLFASVDLTSSNAVSDAINKFVDDVLPARLEGSLSSSWSKWRVGIYKEELMKFQSDITAYRNQMQAKYPHLDVKA